MRKYARFFILLFIIFFWSGCADEIVSECEECAPIQGKGRLDTFSGIQTKLFNTTCALSGCHGENAAQANLLLTEGASYSMLVDKPGFLYPQLTRVKPGDSQNSLIIRMLRGTLTQMPPTGKLNDAVIDSVAMWIDNGALNN